MIPKKPAPDLIRGGYRFSEKIMLHHRLERDDESKRSHHALAAPSLGPGRQYQALDPIRHLFQAQAAVEHRPVDSVAPRERLVGWFAIERHELLDVIPKFLLGAEEA